MDYPVGEVARAAGVTVRALHHYEEIGLLVPSARTISGYRLYGQADLERLQQILFYRELGFSLASIAALLDDPKANAMHDAGDGLLLLVASDRISAYDVVMAEPVPNKGRVLTAFTDYWLAELADIAS